MAHPPPVTTLQALFHGPTFPLKEVALQIIANFFEYFLSTGSNGKRLAVLDATSRDTGPVTIYGLLDKKGVDRDPVPQGLCDQDLDAVDDNGAERQHPLPGG